MVAGCSCRRARRAASSSPRAVVRSFSSERAGRWLVAFALALSLTGRAAGAEPPPSAEVDPRQTATELAAEGRWAEAAERFRAALAQHDTAVTRFNLAQAERNSGRLATAQREFARARDLARQSGNYEVERLAEQALSAIAARVPELTIDVPETERGIEARVDGRRVTPGEAIRLDPGRHELRVSASGRRPYTRRVRLREGERLRLAVSFVAPSAPKPAPRRAHEQRAPSASGPPVLAVISLGVGAAAFTTAALLHVRRNDKLEEAGRGCQRDGGEFVCPAGYRSDPEHRELIEAADRAELARDVMLGVGVGAVSGAALVWLLGEQPTERAQVSIGPGSARVSLSF